MALISLSAEDIVVKLDSIQDLQEVVTNYLVYSLIQFFNIIKFYFDNYILIKKLN